MQAVTNTKHQWTTIATIRARAEYKHSSLAEKKTTTKNKNKTQLIPERGILLWHLCSVVTHSDCSVYLLVVQSTSMQWRTTLFQTLPSVCWKGGLFLLLSFHPCILKSVKTLSWDTVERSALRRRSASFSGRNGDANQAAAKLPANTRVQDKREPGSGCARHSKWIP